MPAGTRSSARLSSSNSDAAASSSSPLSKAANGAAAGTKRKASGASPVQGKRGRGRPKKQKTIEETMPNAGENGGEDDAEEGGASSGDQDMNDASEGLKESRPGGGLNALKDGDGE